MRLKLLIFLIGVTHAAADVGSGTVGITPVLLPNLPLGLVTLPNGKALNLSVAAGAGAYHMPSDPARRIWTITDRGPSFDCMAEALHDKTLCPPGRRGRVFLLPGYSPSIYAIDMADVTARFTEMVTIKGTSGRPLSGLSNPPGTGRDEAAYAADGHTLDPDPSGIEPGGLVRLKDGSFIIAEGYGPSLLILGADGMVRRRLVPDTLGDIYRDADYPVEPLLPAWLARRGFSRGFAGIALSADEKQVYVALGGVLPASETGPGDPPTQIRILKIDLATGKTLAQFAYPLDEPASPAPVGDGNKVPPGSDGRVVELVTLDDTHLLVLERKRAIGRIYRIDLAAVTPPGPDTTAATFKQPPAAPGSFTDPLVPLTKTLMFSTEYATVQFGRLSGMAVLSDREIAVTASEFGTDGARTQLFRLTFPSRLTN